jgi:hypothetical protein
MKSSKARATETGTLIGVRLQGANLAAVDTWRKMQIDLPSRPEAIRRLLTEALGKPADAGSIAAGELEHGLDDVERKIDAMIDKLTKR